MTPCGFVRSHWRFVGAYCLNLQYVDQSTWRRASEHLDIKKYISLRHNFYCKYVSK